MPRARAYRRVTVLPDTTCKASHRLWFFQEDVGNAYDMDFTLDV
jgi:hypothetical protein